MKNILSYISVSFSALIVLFVTAAAIAFSFTDFMLDRIYGGKRVVLTIIFIAYAIYRSFRIYLTFKSNKD